ncbi:MAG TPA: hypothetical protein VL494_13535 [Steroidobacteraceae bacterium]|jgi:hypothetical protein|nr:hypothetical protein [Steroidobacteraceae bacterium]
MANRLTPTELLDADLAILLVTAPIWIAGFVGLAVAGWWNDRRGVARG